MRRPTLTNLCIYSILTAILSAVLLYSCRKEVDNPLQIDFTYTITDSNYTVPVTINFTNKTSGAQFYKWTFLNGKPAESDQRNPGYIVFDQPGPVSVKLEAWNDFERQEKTVLIVLDTVPVADFAAIPRINNFSPVEWDFNFTGKGATRFTWTFENGSVISSTDRNPRQISYSKAGTYRIKLLIANERGKVDSVSKLITVLPPMAASFDIQPSFEDDDLEAPLTAKLDNHTTGATTHQWQVQGGVLSNAADSAPVVTFQDPGTYTVNYTATNGKQTELVVRTITVKPNTGLRSFTDVHLGINTAHASIGSFFSTYLRKTITKDSVNAVNGPFIDLCYFGLSQSFAFNKFQSPAEVQDFTFQPIPGATNTLVINRQESCNCGINVTPAQFDNITTGTFFDNLNIISTAGGIAEFDNTVVPRMVLFKNAAGKKGAIKIKQFVQDGSSSYIICDIKVQKN
jgi:PKD repeat protein